MLSDADNVCILALLTLILFTDVSMLMLGYASGTTLRVRGSHVVPSLPQPSITIPAARKRPASMTVVARSRLVDRNAVKAAVAHGRPYAGIA